MTRHINSLRLAELGSQEQCLIPQYRKIEI